MSSRYEIQMRVECESDIDRKTIRKLLRDISYFDTVVTEDYDENLIICGTGELYSSNIGDTIKEITIKFWKVYGSHKRVEWDVYYLENPPMEEFTFDELSYKSWMEEV